MPVSVLETSHSDAPGLLSPGHHLTSSTGGHEKMEPERPGVSFPHPTVHLSGLLPTHQEPNQHILAAVSCTGTSVQGSRL